MGGRNPIGLTNKLYVCPICCEYVLCTSYDGSGECVIQTGYGVGGLWLGCGWMRRELE